jgi:hypothetical protein
MKVARWGNSLAMRLPAKLVDDMGLKEGDELNLRQLGDLDFNVHRAGTISAGSCPKTISSTGKRRTPVRSAADDIFL